MSAGVDRNPFVGPRPYTEAERELFQGREEVASRLVDHVFTSVATTLYGPSGAGKSSLMQAAVLPRLRDERGFRVVSVDGWPPDREAGALLIGRMVEVLRLAVPETSEAVGLEATTELARQRSDRPVLLYLDQVEQLLQPGREQAGVRRFFEELERLVRPAGRVQLVVALREDYLGAFRDRARGLRVLLAQGFRLSPLTVREMTGVVVALAGAQKWAVEETAELMLQVRVPGQSAVEEAEVQAAFAQIVCRALWKERAEGGDFAGPAKAEPILHRYLDETIDALGLWKVPARRLLEEHLVALDGSRTLLTERQAVKLLEQILTHEARQWVGTLAGVFTEKHAEQVRARQIGANKVLSWLERAAVLRAEEHQGGQYFELGHDWLASKVFDLGRERRERQEKEQKLGETRATLLRLISLGMVAGILAATMVALWHHATVRVRANALLVDAAQELVLGNSGTANQLLLEIDPTACSREWASLAREVLALRLPNVTLRHSGPVLNATFSRDGKWVVTASRDETARVWRVDGKGERAVLRGHSGAVLSAAFSPDANWVVTASTDGTARVWKADGKREAVVLRGHSGAVLSAAFSPDGERVVTASDDGTARVWRVDRAGDAMVLRGHAGAVLSAAFSPDGKRVVTTSVDGTARVWSWSASSISPAWEVVEINGHVGAVFSAAFTPDGWHVVTASRGGTLLFWSARSYTFELRGMKKSDGELETIALSPNLPIVVAGWSNSPIVVAGWSNGTVQLLKMYKDSVWAAQDALVIKEHSGAILAAAFSPDGKQVVTGSSDRTAHVWKSDGRGERVEFRGHSGAIRSVMFSPDGERVLTASDDGTARIWTLSVPRLQAQLREANVDCLTPDQRQRYLDEEDAVARKKYEDCERSYGRLP